MTTILQQVVTALRDGAYQADDGYLRLQDRIGRSRDVKYSASHRVRDLHVTSILGKIDTPSQIQQLYLNDADHIDLADLAPLPNLRELSVNRARAITGTLPHHMPVEALSLDAAEADIDGLHGHPTVWFLTLAGRPSSIAALATLPSLTHLDLSAAETTELELLTELPALRVLTLNPAQWRRLRESHRIPPRLAAAAMTGRTRLADALDWAQALSG